MGFPGAHNVRRRPQGLGVARDVSAPRIGDLASPTDCRTPRQIDGHRHPDSSAERHVGCGRAINSRRRTGVRKSDATIQIRRSGVLGRRSQFAARPLGWSDLDRLLELADGPAPCQISIPEPAVQGYHRHSPLILVIGHEQVPQTRRPPSGRSRRWPAGIDSRFSLLTRFALLRDRSSDSGAGTSRR